jgi:phasin family protein
VAYYEVAMLSSFDDVQKFGKDNVEATMRSFGAASKGFQAIAAEVTNYSKKSFEDGTAAVERLMGAKTLDKAIEVHSDYVKSAYEGFVAQATKLGELYADIAKETYKPLEAYFTKAA